MDLTRQWAQLLEQAEQLKASIRAKVKRLFHVINNLFGHKKVRYRGLAKNTTQSFSLFSLANLVIAKRSLLALYAPRCVSSALSGLGQVQSTRKSCCATCAASN